MAKPELKIQFNPRLGKPRGDFLHFVESHEFLHDHFFFQTSGSTGLPKWVALSPAALAVSARAVNDWLKVTSNDIFGLALPTFHVGGFGLALRAQMAGCTCHRLPEWDAQNFVSWLGEKKISITSLVPTQVYDLIRTAQSPVPSLRAVVVGGGGLAQEVLRSAQQLGWPILASYGLTECASQVATSKLAPAANQEIAQVYLLPHMIAEERLDGVFIKSKSLLTGYLFQSSVTEWKFFDPKVDGFFKLPDQVHLRFCRRTGQKILEIMGRGKEEFKILGEWIRWSFLQNLFAELSAQEKIFDSAQLMVVPHLRTGHALTIAYECDEAPMLHLKNLFNAQVFPFERITHKVRCTFPRTELGKVVQATLQANVNSNLQPVS